MSAAPPRFSPGNLVRARGREWVVLPGSSAELLRLRPLGGASAQEAWLLLAAERRAPVPARFPAPGPERPGNLAAAALLLSALRLRFRSGAGPFRSFAALAFSPKAYQLVPLMMALRMERLRLLIADDVGVGKTIEAGLIVKELLERGEVARFTVICPPYLCDQWQAELRDKFALDAAVVRSQSAARLERGLGPEESLFAAYPYTVVSLDFIKSERRRAEFLASCPELVVIDEAHSCVQAGAARHQRYQLVRALADSPRHLLLLTATPHSGDDRAFSQLLGFLDPRFAELTDLPEGDRRSALREQLALQLVQRRRKDIADWGDQVFPQREVGELAYPMGRAWGKLFADVLAYARELVRRAEGGGQLQRRMSFWAALALLRCLSSSPAAAEMALRTRLQVQGESELPALEESGERLVLDSSEDLPDDLGPAAALPDAEAAQLNDLAQRSARLRGKGKDPKLSALIPELAALLDAGFNPVVFCRYQATAHYLGAELEAEFGDRAASAVVTGELDPDARRQLVAELCQQEGSRLLVATDCLSEGINLQSAFDAVVHYDLTWNPTRHEQREGRVDRFGQPAPKVRILTLYGQGNPVDEAILKVILRKAERIRKELGVAVPVPVEPALIERVMRGVLSASYQPVFDFAAEEPPETEQLWQAARRGPAQLTIFAQRRLRPAEALAEWERTSALLGDSSEVFRFVQRALSALGAPLEARGDGSFGLALGALPPALAERLRVQGVPSRLSFSLPAPPGSELVHRAHPLTAALADYASELAWESPEGAPEFARARTAAAFVAVPQRRTLYLLRLRCALRRLGQGGEHLTLVEECLGAESLAGSLTALEAREVAELLELEPQRNMEAAQRSALVQQALSRLPELEGELARLAEQRAAQLLADHCRVQGASLQRGVRYEVEALPPDLIGVYALLPVAR